MGLMEYYLIFALTTSIFAIIDVFTPLLSKAKADGVKNVLTENYKLSVFVYFILTVIMAPFIILPLLVPSMNIRFRDSLSKIINEAEEI